MLSSGLAKARTTSMDIANASSSVTKSNTKAMIFPSIFLY
jgi:hypothetical protein